MTKPDKRKHWKPPEILFLTQVALQHLGITNYFKAKRSGSTFQVMLLGAPSALEFLLGQDLGTYWLNSCDYLSKEGKLGVC